MHNLAMLPAEARHKVTCYRYSLNVGLMTHQQPVWNIESKVGCAIARIKNYN